MRARRATRFPSAHSATQNLEMSKRRKAASRGVRYPTRSGGGFAISAEPLATAELQGL